MKRITIIRALAVLAVVSAVAVMPTTSKHTVPAVYAAPGCSDATLNGNYAIIQPAGFTAPGSGSSTTGSEVPRQFVGVATFLNGTLSANWTAAVNGAISGADLQKNPQTSAGSYTVNSDCTGSLTLTGPDAPGTTANIVITGGGAEVFAISTNSGDTATVIEKKQ